MILTDAERFNLMTAAITFLTLKAREGSMGRLVELERIVARLQADQDAVARLAVRPQST